MAARHYVNCQERVGRAFSRLVLANDRFVASGFVRNPQQLFLYMTQVAVLERQRLPLQLYIREVVLFFCCLALFFSGFSQPASHRQQGLIYGRVATVEDLTLEGVLRWGNEEAFWDDLFIARKQINQEVFRHLSGDEIRQLTRQPEKAALDWSFWGLWEPRYPSGLQQFRCFFGDMAAIEVTGPTTAVVYYKDGRNQPVQDGGIPGKELHVYDRDDVETRIEWGRIRKIEFLPTPPQARKKQVQPLYGSVFTPQGAFKGFIQWDVQERLSTDLLDGKDEGGKVSLLFDDIQEIRSEGDSSTIRTYSGRTYTLGGGDDVGPGNHGIIVKNIQLGHVRILWSQFRFVRFDRKPPELSPGYHDFGLPGTICSSIRTVDGESVSGRTVFDLDETLTLETLEGRKDGVFYHIPIRNIRQIIRKNYHVSGVILRNGDQLYLSEEHDLTDANWGLLVWVNDVRIRYIPWNQIESITFSS